MTNIGGNAIKKKKSSPELFRILWDNWWARDKQVARRLTDTGQNASMLVVTGENHVLHPTPVHPDALGILLNAGSDFQ